MPFNIGDLAAPITAGASLGAAAIQRNWALKDWNRVNAYNHPKQQIARNREAGLPLAAMFSGSGGSTSSDVRSSGIDPTLGTAQGLGAYMQNRMQKKQLEMIDQQIREQTASADIKEGERDYLIHQGIIVPIDKNDPASEGGVFHSLWRSNQQQSMEYGQRQKGAQAQSAEIIARLQEAKTQAEIDHILQSIGLSQENQRGQKIANDINAILTGKIGDGKWDLIQSMIYKFLFK